jgi:pimeloyl-ACP methyl ester carboxylesterase
MIAAAWVIGAALLLLGLTAAGLALFSARTARQVEQAVPPLGRFIEVDGARIHYLDEGSGSPLLLIHGLAGQMRHFTYSLLDRLKSDYRVVILDRPGSGYSTRPPQASAAISAQARTIARFAKALGLERPLVVGHSLGGAIALSLALDHPEQVGGLALIAPATHPQEHVSPVFRALVIRSALLRWLVAWTLATPLSIRNGALALKIVFGPEPIPADFATRGGGLLTLRPRSFIGASRDLVAVVDDFDAMPARYQSLTVPVGILFGASDRILDPAAHGEALAKKLPGADFELIEGGGHMIPMTAAERSAKFIVRMAQRVAATGAKPTPVS